MKKIFKTMIASALGLFAFGAGMYALNRDFTANADGTEVTQTTENVVSVVMNGETTYHTSFADALTAVEGQESAEIKLLADTEGATAWVFTNLTLDLNGFTLSNTCLSTDSSMGIPSSLIIQDSSEAKTGKITGISGSGWTFYSGNNIINGGSFDRYVGFYVETGVTLEINGGNFEELDISDGGGTATLNDFYATKILLYNGNKGIQLKGGSFQNADIRNSTLQDCIADGYKVIDENGVFVDCNVNDLGEREWDSENGTYIYLETFTVVEHFTCTFEAQKDETHHWTACACGATEDGSELVKEEHKGGTATCIEKAVCEVCETVYGGFGEHRVENTTCELCNETFTTRLTLDETVYYYASFADALTAAQGQESAEITLLTDTEGVDVWLSTNLTLDLNGFTLSKANLSTHGNTEYSSLIIKDSSEGKTGKIVDEENVYWSLNAGENAIYGGTFEGIAFSVVGEGASLTIHSGSFDQLDVFVETGAATLNDFYVQYLILHNKNGGIQLKNGSFQYVYIQESTLQDLLADGYKLVDEDGVFVDCNVNDLGDLDWDSENETYIYLEKFTVVEHFTCSFEVQKDETHHWYACACGATEDGSEIVKEEHKGGTATCTEKAACEVCGIEYGDVGDHTVDTNWHKDETHHWQGCIHGVEGGSCQETFNRGEHADEDKNGECDVCAKEMPLPKAEKSGCGSVVGAGSALTIIGAAAVALAFRKRKEN